MDDRMHVVVFRDPNHTSPSDILAAWLFGNLYDAYTGSADTRAVPPNISYLCSGRSPRHALKRGLRKAALKYGPDPRPVASAPVPPFPTAGDPR